MPFGKRRGGFSRKNGFKRRKFQSMLASTLPDQSFLWNYVDQVATSATTNGLAYQALWGVQQAAFNTGVNEDSTLSAAITPICSVTTISTPEINLQSHSLPLMQMLLSRSIGINGGTPGPTSQVLIKDYSCNVKWTNLNTGPVELTEYRCKARRDFSAGFGAPTGVSVGIQGVIHGGFLDNNPAGQGGSTTAFGTGSINPVTANTYGATLFQNPRFCSTVKVLKKKVHYMKPGQSCFIGYQFKRPRIFKMEDFNFGYPAGAGGVTYDLSTAPSRGMLRGQTFSVFCARGTWATDQSANSGFKVGVGNVALGGIYTIRCHYAVIAPNAAFTSGMNMVAGFGDGSPQYPLPLVATWPYRAIATGTTNTAGASQEATVNSAVIPEITMDA